MEGQSDPDTFLLGDLLNKPEIKVNIDIYLLFVDLLYNIITVFRILNAFILFSPLKPINLLSVKTS